MAATTPSLRDLRFSLAGPGKVGRSLAAWLVAQGAAWVATSGGSGATAATGGPPHMPLDRLATEGEDLLLLALPEAALTEVATRLAERPQAAVALHVSGRLGAEVLAPLRRGGTAVGALHPLLAFPEASPNPAASRGVFFALDGDGPALALARRLVAAWQGTCAVVPAAARPLYHLAATLAAGGVTTLVAVAADIARAAGLPEETAAGYLALARGALAATPPTRPAAGVTGPLARGDAGYSRQIAELAVVAPRWEPLVVELALATLSVLAEDRGGAPNEAQERLAAELRQRAAAAARQTAATDSGAAGTGPPATGPDVA